MIQKTISFLDDVEHISLPKKLNNPFDYAPHPLCKLAAKQLQNYLSEQTEWEHNFGLGGKNENTDLKAIGKMFGVLVVEDLFQQLSFLAAFSGKLANSNLLPNFVPPVYDSLADDGFLTPGMKQLKVINDQIKNMQAAGCKASQELLLLKEKRKVHSQSLQHKLFLSYNFLNTNGKYRNPYEIFGSNPPAGAGECAAPKLLQYAFLNNLRPVAIAEFWWGCPPNSETVSRNHREFYPACLSKCKGVLGWMLNRK